MNIETFLEKTGLSKKYKGSQYIKTIINDCDHFQLFETSISTIIKTLAKINNKNYSSVKRDILYAKKKHLEKMDKEIKIKLFGSNVIHTEPSTKDYLILLKIAIENNVENILPTKIW